MAIKLTEIVQDNENLQVMKTWGTAAKKVAADLLHKRGLENADYFTLRIKENSKLKDWIALYRGNSVLSGRPIFWVNARLPEIAKESGADTSVVRIIVDNILHEWWHAICDGLRAARFRGVQVKTPIGAEYDNDEETRAEQFISFCGGDAWQVLNDEDYKYFDGAIKEFNDLWG